MNVLEVETAVARADVQTPVARCQAIPSSPPLRFISRTIFLKYAQEFEEKRMAHLEGELMESLKAVVEVHLRTTAATRSSRVIFVLDTVAQIEEKGVSTHVAGCESRRGVPSLVTSRCCLFCPS